jgi:hypothetical protein
VNTVEKSYSEVFEAAFQESFWIPLPKGTEKKKVSGAQKLFRIFWEAFRSLYPGTVLSQAFKFHYTKGNLEFRYPLHALNHRFPDPYYSSGLASLQALS